MGRREKREENEDSREDEEWNTRWETIRAAKVKSRKVSDR